MSIATTEILVTEEDCLPEDERKVRETLQALELELKRVMGEGEVGGFIPVKETPYKSHLVPYCGSDSMLNALLATGISSEEIADALDLSCAPQEREAAIVKFFHHQVAGKDEKTFLDFPRDGIRIANRLKDLGLISAFETPGRPTDVYLRALAGYRGAVGIPGERHIVGMVGAIQLGQDIDGGYLAMVDPQELYQAHALIHPSGLTMGYVSSMTAPPIRMVPVRDFVNQHFRQGLDIQGLAYSCLFTK